MHVRKKLFVPFSLFHAYLCYCVCCRLQKPVRCMLDRDEDMLSTGQRHPFHAKYTVGFNDDGTLTACDVTLYSNAGISHDLSGPVSISYTC